MQRRHREYNSNLYSVIQIRRRNFRAFEYKNRLSRNQKQNKNFFNRVYLYFGIFSRVYYPYKSHYRVTGKTSYKRAFYSRKRHQNKAGNRIRKRSGQSGNENHLGLHGGVIISSEERTVTADNSGKYGQRGVSPGIGEVPFQ